MSKLPLRTWILNAAAVLSGRHGTVTQQAREAGCSRETVYEHARKVEQRLEPESGSEAVLAELRAENQRLRRLIAELEREAGERVRCDKVKQRQLATTAFAMGISLRQIETLLGLLLPAEQVPDHSTLGHWIEVEARRAGQVLAVVDMACAPRVRTLALDEIFLGGDRPWSGWSRGA
jgi:AcrR family transcriptional regulator